MWKAKNETELASIAQAISASIQHPILLLKGEMGAGKTTFVRHLLASWGCTDEVSSPTYSIVNEYATEKKGKVYHFDFYRIENEEEAYDIGWEEYAYSGHICLIEWAERIPNLLPEKFHLLEIKATNDVRTFDFS